MIDENFKIIEEKINETCIKTNRKIDDITLVAVSKNNNISSISEAYSAGILNFGENKAQELRDKSKLVKENVIWHFIGHLQTNKVKYIIDTAEYIHSVDSVKLTEEINKRATGIDKIQKILIEINTSGENSKYGIKNLDELNNITNHYLGLSNIELVGLMTMAPFIENENIIRESFIRLREYKEELNKQGLQLTELSMGMTNDYQIAIEEGATMLRIGTAIFGKRDYSLTWRDE
ncbi:MAG: YggS family pyridoxal phosphate-dependent enzyme [Candidatus Pacebacteria bacterium]|nr:YggS family pyridoxal phosphate-dependent enzyme [Candidatus Paceibacterota bacterium]